MKFYTGRKTFSPPVLEEELEEEYGVIGCKYDSQYGVYNLLAFDEKEKLHRISVIPDSKEVDVDEYNILERGWDDWQISLLTPDDIYFFFKEGE
jgi:hypothetical protein